MQKATNIKEINQYSNMSLEELTIDPVDSSVIDKQAVDMSIINKITSDNLDEDYDLAESDFVLYLAKKTAIKLKNDLYTFINVTCYHEISNYIRCYDAGDFLESVDSALKKITVFKDIEQNYPLDFKKIIDILKIHKDQISCPAVIAMACNLKIGNVKVIYKIYYDDKLDHVLFSDSLANDIKSKLMYDCIIEYPLLRYVITFIYEISDNLSISFLTLYFKSVKFEYSIVAIQDLFEYVEEKKEYVAEMNSKSISQLATNLWENSVLVRKKQIVQNLYKFNSHQLHKWYDNIATIILQEDNKEDNEDKISNNCYDIENTNNSISIKFIDYIANYILKHNTLECKVIKQKLTTQYHDFCYLKSYKMFKAYQKILTYLKQAGLEQVQLYLHNNKSEYETGPEPELVDQWQIDPLNNPNKLEKQEFDIFKNPFYFGEFSKNIVDLPLIDSDEGSSHMTILYKYNCIIDEVISIINILINDQSSENSSSNEFDSLESLKLK